MRKVGTIAGKWIKFGVTMADMVQEDGSFNFAHLLEMIDDEAGADVPEDAIVARAAAKVPVPDLSVRRSARQAAALGKVIKRFDL